MQRFLGGIVAHLRSGVGALCSCLLLCSTTSSLPRIEDLHGRAVRSMIDWSARHLHDRIFAEIQLISLLYLGSRTRAPLTPTEICNKSYSPIYWTSLIMTVMLIVGSPG